MTTFRSRSGVATDGPAPAPAAIEGLLVRVVGKPRRTLEERLAAYDPRKHGGQFVEDGLIGVERF